MKTRKKATIPGENAEGRLTAAQKKAGAALERLCAEFVSERSVLAQAEHLAQGKALYLARFPETAQGAAPGKAGGGKAAKTDTVAAFADWIAKRISTSSRQVRRLVFLGENIDRKVCRKIHGTRLANRTRDLEAVAKIKNPEHQMEVVSAYRIKAEGDSSGFKKALSKFVNEVKPAAKVPWTEGPHPIEVHKPIEVKLPIGKLLVELVQSADGLSLRFADPRSGAGQQVAVDVSTIAPTNPAVDVEGASDPVGALGPTWATLMAATAKPATKEQRKALSGVHGKLPKAVHLELPEGTDLAAAVYGEHAAVAAELIGKKSTVMRRIAVQAGLTALKDDPLDGGQEVLIAFGNPDSSVIAVAIGLVRDEGNLPSDLYAIGHAAERRFACRLSLHDDALGKMLGTWVGRGSRAPRIQSRPSAADSSNGDDEGPEREGRRVESVGPRSNFEDDVLVGDCETILPTLATESVDAIITDPPYGLGRKPPSPEAIDRYLAGAALDVGGDFMGADWSFPTIAVWRECLRVLKPGGVLACFAGTRTLDLMTVALEAAGFKSEPTLMWVYGSGFPKSVNVAKALKKKGSSQAAYFEGWGTALKPAWEPILIFGKPGGAGAAVARSDPFFYCSKASRRERTLGGRVRNTHPTVKPLKLMRWLVQFFVPDGGVLLDPYAGSGTTALAALAEGRSFVLVEKDRKFATVAQRRIQVACADPSLIRSLGTKGNGSRQ